MKIVEMYMATNIRNRVNVWFIGNNDKVVVE